jgi:hypothetical protein
MTELCLTATVITLILLHKTQRDGLYKDWELMFPTDCLQMWRRSVTFPWLFYAWQADRWTVCWAVSFGMGNGQRHKCAMTVTRWTFATCTPDRLFTRKTSRGHSWPRVQCTVIDTPVLETRIKIRLVSVWLCWCGSHRSFDVDTN